MRHTILSFITLAMAFIQNIAPGFAQELPQNEVLFKRIVSAQIYAGNLWIVEQENPPSVGAILAKLSPTYVSGLLCPDPDENLSSEQINAYHQIRELVLAAQPQCKFDLVLCPNLYKEPEDLIARMRYLNDMLHLDGWLLDFVPGTQKASAKLIEAAVAYAHSQNQFIGGNELNKSLLKMGDFVVLHDGQTIDLKFKEEILNLSKTFNIPILFQINTHSQRGADDTTHTFMKKWQTHQREEHLKRLARNQVSWRYHLMYPVFFPVYLNKNAYNASRDGMMLKSLLELMAQYN
ncbi:MAG: hypothetical protein HC913_08915 [Microscillaceae bacterium]|nr:hypothetical protein [Microscillaceae bacterium]